MSTARYTPSAEADALIRHTARTLICGFMPEKDVTDSLVNMTAEVLRHMYTVGAIEGYDRAVVRTTELFTDQIVAMTARLDAVKKERP